MAFDSVSNISIVKPHMTFSVNDWVVNTTLSKPTFSVTWASSNILPKISVNFIISNIYIINTVLPKVIFTTNFIADNVYTCTRILNIPKLTFTVTSPNTYSLQSVLKKPVFIGHINPTFSGVVNSTLPLINVSFNVVLTSNTTKQTWVFNTITTAHSRYTNFNFNSFFKLGSINYGINANGDIYKLVGLKDFVGEATEANIDAEVILPASTFESQNLKSCSDAIMYGRGNGDMEVQIVLDEQQIRTGYTIHFDSQEGMHRKRVMPPIPKGLKGNVWQYILKNIDGSWFDINMFEVFVREMQRIK